MEAVASTATAATPTESPSADTPSSAAPPLTSPTSAPSPGHAAPPIGVPAEEAPLRSRMRSKSATGEEGAKPVPTQRPGGEPRGGRGPRERSGDRAKGSGKPQRGPREERSDRTAKSPAPADQASAEAGAADERSEKSAGSPAPESRPAKVIAPPPVELPSADALDAELEAAIAAAQSTAAEQQPVAAAARAQDEEQTGEPATPLTEDELEPGMKLSGKVQTITGDDVFVDLGFRSSGVVSLRQFEPSKKPLPGQLFEVVIDRVDPEEGLIHVSLPKGVRRRVGGWETIAKGQIIECMVARTNKGGLEISVGGLRGFLPASQVDLHYVGDLEPYIGQKLRVQITEANPRKRNLVVSRRAVLVDERKEAEEHLWQTLEVGQTFDGTVKTLKDYGAFVDIGGVDGFVHVGEISWSHIRRPGDVLQVGQQVRVKVLNIDREKNKIGLGIRQLQQNPWDGIESRYPKGQQFRGAVTRTTEFGAFVELEPGVEGLVHISELDHQRVRKVTDVLKTGQEVDVQVLESDAEKKRISLSVKALLAKPEAAPRPEEPAPEPYIRKHKEPLKGGTGAPAQTGGGLFGNPRDFK
ncbi:MAG: S1 RNA-binding domain-containing protein [Planctomycetaceae bacterium]